MITFFANYYRDIQAMPIGHFTKCLSGDLSYVSKNKYCSPQKAAKLWPKIFNQHIKAHGLPDSYVRYVGKMKRALGLYAEAYNGKKWQIVRARVYEAEAKLLLSGEGERIETTCARISKFMGFPVRANECSVVEFYNYVAIMEST